MVTLKKQMEDRKFERNCLVYLGNMRQFNSMQIENLNAYIRHEKLGTLHINFLIFLFQFAKELWDTL